MFLKIRERGGGGGKETQQAPKSCLLAGQEVGLGVGLLCPQLFNPFPPWVGQAGREARPETSQGLGILRRILPAYLSSTRGQGCGRFSLVAPFDGSVKVRRLKGGQEEGEGKEKLKEGRE